jgi:hypothetical protein
LMFKRYGTKAPIAEGSAARAIGHQSLVIAGSARLCQLGHAAMTPPARCSEVPNLSRRECPVFST